MPGPTALDYVTLGIAGVGAVTGVAALGATWAQFALSGPRLVVTHSSALATAEPEWLLGVTVENRGRMPASLTGVSLKMSSGHHIPIAPLLAQRTALGPDFPHRLEPYSEASWYLKPWAVAQALIEAKTTGHVRAYASYSGKRTYAKKTFDALRLARTAAQD